jgi:triacylglycerol esterase/lipase EstA (alpha/beta hydrolase family)
MRTVKFYSGDRNCQNGDETRYSSDLHDPLYKSLCTDYHPGSEGIQWEGTNDESIYHLSCLFAQYLNYNFGRDNRNVVLVGHSMGGLIMRETIYQMQENAGKSPFPPTIGHVEKAITFNTPHNSTIEVLPTVHVVDVNKVMSWQQAIC